MSLLSFLKRLGRAEGGMAFVELAYTLPIIVPLFVGGAEVTNYAITRMRISQIALHVADNASRIGTESLISAPRISEAQINDLLIGANLQGGTLDIETNGRIIISSVEPKTSPNNPSGKFKIAWQRCYGDLNWPSSYGVAGATDLNGVGPAGRQATAPAGGGTMFVEVAYRYEPLVAATFVEATRVVETAAMTVRDKRDYSAVYNPESVAVSSC